MDQKPQPLITTTRGRTGRGPHPRGVIGRRDLIKLTAGAGVAAFGVAGRGLILPWVHTSRAAEGEPLVEPEVRASRDGLLDTTLTCSIMPVSVAGQTAIMSVYEGALPGPTLRVRPGDRLRVKLVNNLEALPAELPADSPFRCSALGGPAHAASGEHATTCDTNLHTHGFHVSPSGNSDNIFLIVKAGESFQYEYQIPPDHPSGVYHYHPHLHGAAHIQVFGGMVGAIIIEGDLDRLPGIDGVPERMLILQTTQLTPDGGSVIAQGAGAESTYLRMVNGQLNPTMTIRPGETQRWRLMNLTASTTFRLRLDGHQLHQIAKDGNTLNETWTRDEIILLPGERVEALVQGGPAGTYTLRTLPITTGFTTQVAATLATLVSAGDAVTPQPLPTTLLPLEDLSTADIDERRRISFQIKPPIARPTGPHGPTAQIDSHFFDAERDDQVVRLNTTEEWVIRNASTEWHPFHIHINDYQVVAVNGQPVPVRYNEDTTPVPPLGEITIRTRFRDFPGRWVYHCHILLHEDLGMMGTVKALS
jgi:FtsP/CotA-like multicopper oxidase with cupredoxin domain